MKSRHMDVFTLLFTRIVLQQFTAEQYFLKHFSYSVGLPALLLDWFIFDAPQKNDGFQLITKFSL